MYNQIAGTVVIFTVLVLYYASFYNFRRQYFNTALILIVAAGLVLRIFAACDFYLHDWDEQFHALVAKNTALHPLKPTLYEHPVLPYDYKNWTGNHIWLHKPPFTLWIMGLSIKIFGNNELAVRFPSVVFSSISILLIYLVSKRIFGVSIAIVAAYLQSVNGLVIEVTAGRVPTDHVDLFFMFFVLLSIYTVICFKVKNVIIRDILVAVCIALAVLCKWLPALIVLPIWYIKQHMESSKFQSLIARIALILFCVIIIVLPWQLFIADNFRNEYKWENYYNYLHLIKALDGQTGDYLYYLNKIRINYGELIYLPLLFLLYQMCFFQKHRYHILIVVLWIIIPIIFFTIAKTKMQGYLLFSAPAYFIATAYFIAALFEFRLNQYVRYIFVFLLLFLPFRYMIERVKPFDNMQRTKPEVIALKKYDFSKNTVLFGYPKPIQAMFYKDITAAYIHLPSKEIQLSLQRKGYLLYVFSDNQFKQINYGE